MKTAQHAGAGWVPPTKATTEVFPEEAALCYLATLPSCWQGSRSHSPQLLFLLGFPPAQHPLTQEKPTFSASLSKQTSSDISVLGFLLSQHATTPILSSWSHGRAITVYLSTSLPPLGLALHYKDAEPQLLSLHRLAWCHDTSGSHLKLHRTLGKFPILCPGFLIYATW